MLRFLRSIQIIATGLLTALATPASSRAADRYADVEALYAALSQQPNQRLAVGGGQIDIVFADGAPGLDHQRVINWVRTSAVAVSTYFGRFPVPRVGILIIADDSDRIHSGTTYGLNSSAIRIRVGRRVGSAGFQEDWMLVHEMTHLALPSVPRRSHWLLEGNATYVEPIARAQARQLDPAMVWRWSLEGMPQGVPKPGEQGLDNTPTWGRTYWGGAIFWLLADVRIREQTHGRLSAQDALRAINQSSGGNTSDWTVDRVMAEGDRATGTRVLSTLYAEMRLSPTPVNLQDLFAKLGVSERAHQIVFDDGAPLSSIRRSITDPPARQPF